MHEIINQSINQSINSTGYSKKDWNRIQEDIISKSRHVNETFLISTKLHQCWTHKILNCYHWFSTKTEN